MNNSYLTLIVQNRSFRRLWSANLISSGGDWFSTIALLGLAVELTGTNAAAGAVLAANMLPSFLAAPIAGPVADRFNRRRVMVASDVIRIFLALGMLLVRSESTVWIGLACTAGLSTCSAFFMPAAGAALPNIVKREHLGAANALMSASWGIMLVFGACRWRPRRSRFRA